MAKMPLNEGQQAAADEIFSFLMGSTKSMGIIGPGGVGKTVLLGHIVDEVIPMYHNACKLLGIDPKYTEVAMLSTTNAAAAVLSQECGRPTQTAASFFGLKVTENNETGETKLTPTDRWTIHHNMVIFIDEASTIDTEMYKYIDAGTIDCKIIYVGDDCQMNPVKEKISPVYNPDLGINHFELTKIERSSDPHILALNLQLRQQVKDQKVTQAIKIVPGVIDWYDEQQMADAIDKSFVNTKVSERMLAYTNKKVVAFNEYIRSLRNLPHAFTVGEQLIANHPYAVGRTYSISIGEEFEVIDIDPRVQTQHVANTPEGDVEITYNLVTLRNRIGLTLEGCRVPTNRDHFKGVLDWLSSTKQWSKFFSVKRLFLDLRQRDASTVYKAQGSSEDTVYIDLSNISRCNIPDQVFRMLYVAVSRARKHIVFFGELSEKYGVLQF